MTGPWSDAEMLEALHLRDACGLSAGQIARKVGRSRNAVLGVLHRIDAETDATDRDGNQNGTMPARWWKRTKS
jgi:hypothetical protein